MDALITLDMNAEVAARIPAPMLSEITQILTQVSRLNCREINPHLPEEFGIIRVKAGWRGERWMPGTVHMHGPFRGQFTWYPEFYWLTIGVPEVIEHTVRYSFSGSQTFDRFDNGDLRLLPILQLSHTYIWWQKFFDDVLEEDADEKKSYEHRDLHHYSGRGGWVQGLTFGEMLLKLARSRLAEAHTLILESYRESEQEMDFTSFELEELMEKLAASATKAA